MILVKGDSISSHAWNEYPRKNLGWDRECGMAASSEEKDYIHLLADAILAVMPEQRIRLGFRQERVPRPGCSECGERIEIPP